MLLSQVASIPDLQAADLFVQESPSAMWDMQEHCVALGLPVQASTDTTSAQTALGNASTGPLQGQQMSQASEVHQLPQADMSLSSAGQIQLPEGGPQGPPPIMELLQQQQEQQTQDARGESMRAAACLLQVGPTVLLGGRGGGGGCFLGRSPAEPPPCGHTALQLGVWAAALLDDVGCAACIAI